MQATTPTSIRDPTSVPGAGPIGGSNVATLALLRIVGAVFWILAVYACYQLAKTKGRSRWGWTLFALVFPGALVILVLASLHDASER